MTVKRKVRGLSLWLSEDGRIDAMRLILYLLIVAYAECPVCFSDGNEGFTRISI